MNTNDSNALFQTSSRLKLRFPTQGLISTEDVWDLSLEQLNDLAVKVHKEIAPDEPNFLEKADRKKSEARRLNELRLEILKVIIATKQEEARLRKEKAEKKAELAELEAILVEKQRGKMEGMSVKALEARIAALKDGADEE